MNEREKKSTLADAIVKEQLEGMREDKTQKTRNEYDYDWMQNQLSRRSATRRHGYYDYDYPPIVPVDRDRNPFLSESPYRRPTEPARNAVGSHYSAPNVMKHSKFVLTKMNLAAEIKKVLRQNGYTIKGIGNDLDRYVEDMLLAMMADRTLANLNLQVVVMEGDEDS